jgi:Type I phosphodiesterase / nucleotide pyrophosphatase
MAPVILIEFNELSPTLLDRWIKEGKLPNFKKFYDNSSVYVTEAEETQAPNLEPWIQWYSLHTGMPFKDHQVFHLTDGPRAQHLDIWQRLLNEGKSVWNCSSMNAKGLAHKNAMFMPDPWCASEKAFPAELNIFHSFVARQVQEYSNADKPMNIGDAVSFIKFMLTHGLSTKTVMSIVKQLWSERKTQGETSWKRAVILDKLLLDVFKHYLKKRKPDFSTFFLNSTAHLQHTYWRCMEPEAFTLKPSDDDLRKYSQAVFFGYQEMDKLLGDFFEIERETGATLVFASALSQQPFLKYDSTGGQNFYRPRKVEDFLKQLGLSYKNIDPVMTHQYLLHFQTAEEKNKAKLLLSAVTVDGVDAFHIEPTHDDTSLYFGCQLRAIVDPKAKVMRNAADTRPFGFYDSFYRIDEIKSGRHHPDGCFWIKKGQHTVHQDKASILDVCPTILGLVGLRNQGLIGQDRSATLGM